MKKVLAFLVVLLALTTGLSCSQPLDLLGPAKAEMSSEGAQDTSNAQLASAPGGRIFYAKNGAIWEWSGGSSKRLTQDEGAMQPSVSPDGTKIVYVQKGNGWSNIHLMDSDGANDQTLTDNKSTAPENSYEYAIGCVWAFYPTWSPTGDQIAYLAEPNSYDLTLWLMNPDGTAARRLMWLQDFTGGEQRPSWSPDGKEIVMGYWPPTTEVAATPTSNLWIVTLDTLEWRQLTVTPDGAYDPVWSPDGRLIAYTVRSGKTNDIWLTTPDGKGMVQITKTGAARSPAWSPDGKHLAYISESGDGFDLWQVDITLSDQGDLSVGGFQQLTHGEHLDAAGGIAWAK